MTKQITNFVSKLFSKKEHNWTISSSGHPYLAERNLKPGEFAELPQGVSTKDILILPECKEFISEQECKQITKLKSKARKDLEDANKFPMRLTIQSGSVICGHCYLGEDIRQWHDGKWVVRKSTKKKIKI